MKVAVEYSFRLGRGGDIHDVVIPAARLLNVPLDIAVVRHLVEQDETMLAELFRDRLPEYRLMAEYGSLVQDRRNGLNQDHPRLAGGL